MCSETPETAETTVPETPIVAKLPQNLYRVKKGLSSRKVPRSNRDKFITLGEVQKLLQTVAEKKNPKWRRDHAAIFLGYFLGLRASETILLCRDNFRDLHHGEVHIRTTKQGLRVPYVCKGCQRKFRVAAARAGEMHSCTHCNAVGKIRLPKGVSLGDGLPPEKSPPVVETVVRGYLEDYLHNCMRPEQTWLFESSPGKRLNKDHLRAIFNSYVMQAGLNKKYSWHALRHGRGVLIMDQFEDLVMVRDSLRQKSLSAAEFYVNLSPKKQEEYKNALDSVTDKLDLGLAKTGA